MCINRDDYLSKKRLIFHAHQIYVNIVTDTLKIWRIFFCTKSRPCPEKNCSKHWVSMRASLPSQHILLLLLVNYSYVVTPGLVEHNPFNTFTLAWTTPSTKNINEDKQKRRAVLNAWGILFSKTLKFITYRQLFLRWHPWTCWIYALPQENLNTSVWITPRASKTVCSKKCEIGIQISTKVASRWY